MNTISYNASKAFRNCEGVSFVLREMHHSHRGRLQLHEVTLLENSGRPLSNATRLTSAIIALSTINKHGLSLRESLPESPPQIRQFVPHLPAFNPNAGVGAQIY